MKIKSASAYNFAGFENISVNFDDTLTYLIGPNGGGKSRVGLLIIWFVMQGIAEKATEGKQPVIGERFRFIGSNGKSSLGEITMYDERKKADIKVIRKLTKAGTELSFSAPLGMQLDQDWLNDLFNIFLISPKKFIELPSLEQAKALGIDTSKEYDQPLAELKLEFTRVNKELSKYDNLEVVEEVLPVVVDDLLKRKDELVAEIADQSRKNRQINNDTRTAWEDAKKQVDEAVQKHNTEQTAKNKIADDVVSMIATLRNYGYTGSELSSFYASLMTEIKEPRIAADEYPVEPIDLNFKPDDFIPEPGTVVYIKEQPDVTDLNDIMQQIITANEINAKAEKYTEYLAKLEDKKAKAEELRINKSKQDDIISKRLEYIQEFKLPFDKLSIDDYGGLLLDGRPLKPPYFSTGELIRIVPTLLSASNPEFKYVFIQDFSMLDENNQQLVIDDLTSKGFQLVVELVGTKPVNDKSCIVLKKGKIIAEQTEADDVIYLEEGTDVHSEPINE